MIVGSLSAFFPFSSSLFASRLSRKMDMNLIAGYDA